MLIRSSYKRPGPIKSSILLDRMSSDMQILFKKTVHANQDIQLANQHIASTLLVTAPTPNDDQPHNREWGRLHASATQATNHTMSTPATTWAVTPPPPIEDPTHLIPFTCGECKNQIDDDDNSLKCDACNACLHFSYDPSVTTTSFEQYSQKDNTLV